MLQILSVIVTLQKVIEKWFQLFILKRKKTIRNKSMQVRSDIYTVHVGK